MPADDPEKVKTSEGIERQKAFGLRRRGIHGVELF